MTALEIKLAVYASLLTALAIGLIWWHHQAVIDGEAKIEAADKVAVAHEQKAIAKQKAADADEAQGVVDALHAQLATLSVQLERAPTVWLCHPTTSPRTMPASGGTASRAQPGEPAQPAVDSGLLSGTGSGTDGGAVLLDIALAGEILATYRERTVDWALKQSK